MKTLSEIQKLEEDSVIIKHTMQEAILLKMLLGKFNPDSAGPFGDMWRELDDAGIEDYSNVIILDQSQPILYLVVQKEE